jgi:hypothetical protein
MAVEYIYVGPEVFGRARGFSQFVDKFDLYVEDGVAQEEIDKLKEGGTAFFKNYDEETDRKVFLKVTEEYISRMKAIGLTKSLSGSSADLAANIYDNSVLINEARYAKFLNELNDSTLNWCVNNDPAYVLWSELNTEFGTVVIPSVREFNGQMDALLNVYVSGKMEMFPDAQHWPDANSTMRISYGKLEGSAPHDGMAYTEHTTLEGILTKNNTGNADFELLPDFRELAESKDYGQYAQGDELWICFTSSNHTTGGNSGSPVIDGEGNLMGLNFDRSWESTMSDYMFDADRCRNITVDIRYVLWIMDKYAGATNLIDEMTLVKGKPAKKKKKCKKKCCKS